MHLATTVDADPRAVSPRNAPGADNAPGAFSFTRARSPLPHSSVKESLELKTGIKWNYEGREEREGGECVFEAGAEGEW